jgi:hypothetical protein
MGGGKNVCAKPCKVTNETVFRRYHKKQEYYLCQHLAPKMQTPEHIET